MKNKITPIVVKRKKVNHNSIQIVENYASGTEIRNLCYQGRMEEISELVPKSSLDILSLNLKKGTYISNSLETFEKEIIYKIRMMNTKEIANLPEVIEGLEHLIKNSSLKTNNICELINSIKSKRYTQTRIQRILLYALLGITKKDMEMSREVTPYIRVLGFNEKGKELLSHINSKNIITSVKRFEESNVDKKMQRMLDIDKIATNIYTMGYKENSKADLDYTMRILQYHYNKITF